MYKVWDLQTIKRIKYWNLKIEELRPPQGQWLDSEDETPVNESSNGIDLCSLFTDRKAIVSEKWNM